MTTIASGQSPVANRWSSRSRKVGSNGDAVAPTCRAAPCSPGSRRRSAAARVVALHARRAVDPQRAMGRVAERVAGQQLALHHEPVERAVERPLPWRPGGDRRAGAASRAARPRARARRTASRRSARRESGSTTAIRRPRASSRWATCSAAHSAAPHEMPASTPSRRATSRAVSSASSSSTAIDLVDAATRSSTGGTKPAPMPWILCGPGPPARQHRRRGGLDGDDPAAPGCAP